MTRFARFDTPLGEMYATAGAHGITGLYFEGGRHAPPVLANWVEEDSPLLRDCAAQVREYIAGTRRAFTVPLALEGTPFQRSVWNAIAAIPYGETVSYAALARRIGSAAASRAVGAATGRNPVSIIVPCHRVVGSDGSETGYAGGIERKRRMLALERAAA